MATKMLFRPGSLIIVYKQNSRSESSVVSHFSLLEFKLTDC
ncbi:MAG: hypothetical protein JG782_389 [Anaerophaga sp.]|nr:hypothetical protein [Anaerophaga sp.]MDI3521484.1 hypothetical protein [Anaerophaga sp.]